jgi:hypothetical protein
MFDNIMEIMDGHGYIISLIIWNEIKYRNDVSEVNKQDVYEYLFVCFKVQ